MVKYIQLTLLSLSILSLTLDPSRESLPSEKENHVRATFSIIGSLNKGEILQTKQLPEDSTIPQASQPNRLQTEKTEGSKDTLKDEEINPFETIFISILAIIAIIGLVTLIALRRLINKNRKL